jgi:ribosomal protein S18 acetylase RimI-like enzyme
MNLRSLTAGDFDTIHTTFLEAFSDYVVKLAPTREQLREMLTRRGWVPELSVGVFDDDRLVAFTLNGFDSESGYDSGTGVIPSHRKRGLARQTMEWSGARLREAGAKRFILEVLEANTPAAALYHQCGFVETRRLQSWTLDRVALAPRSGEREDLSAAKGRVMPAWLDIAPAWQNSTASIARARDPHVVLGDDHGYVVLFPSNGDVAQLAVDPAHRRRGLGTRLLHAAHEAAGKPLRIMNVDTRDAGIAAFLEKAGATRMVVQLEMVLTITP